MTMQVHKRYYWWQNKPVPFWNNSLAIVLVGLTILQLLRCDPCDLRSSSVMQCEYFIHAQESNFLCTSLLTDGSNGGVKEAILCLTFWHELRWEIPVINAGTFLFFHTKKTFKYWSSYLKGLWNLSPWSWLHGCFGDGHLQSQLDRALNSIHVGLSSEQRAELDDLQLSFQHVLF